jgi:hypothetical protein
MRPSPLHRPRAAVLAGTTCLALAAALAAWTPPARATQEHARAEAKDCGFCHVSPKGAGPRNERGREYEANGHRFGVASWSSAEAQRTFLRARSALAATWYAEAARLLDALAAVETLPGGAALVQATRERFAMMPRAWLRSARQLLAKGDRGLPNALQFLARLETQFPGTEEGKEAVRLLDAAAKDPAQTKAADEARAAERVRLLVLRGRTEWDQGAADAARKLFAEALADPRGKGYEREIADLLAGKGGL